MAAISIPLGRTETCLQNLELLLEGSYDRGATVDGGDRASYLAEFLTACARSLTPEPRHDSEQAPDELSRARDVFVRAGLEALAAAQWKTGNEWFQIGIRPREDVGRYGEICRHVACVARRLLNDSLADNFFFMNKPPGMRLRFQAAPGRSSEDLANILTGEVTRWREKGLIDSVEPGVYEPESQLFGGPRSMSFVHALFTVDSLIWLDYHAQCAIEGEAISPAWLVSLAVLRTVLASLDINGWEDLGVWSHIRALGGRRLGADQVSLPMYADVAGQMLDVWSRRNRIDDELHPAVKAIVVGHESALITGAAQWRSGYFCRPGASLGPRAAAAFYVIFHWNRAALSHTEQALLAESLSGRVHENVRK